MQDFSKSNVLLAGENDCWYIAQVLHRLSLLQVFVCAWLDFDAHRQTDAFSLVTVGMAKLELFDSAQQSSQ